MASRRDFLAGAATLLATPAFAHSWYDPFCCNGNDCQPAPEGSVRAGKGGYTVTLPLGSHPMITADFRAVVPYRDSKPSGDNEYHICIFPKDTLRCLYVPSGGV